MSNCFTFNIHLCSCVQLIAECCLYVADSFRHYRVIDYDVVVEDNLFVCLFLITLLRLFCYREEK